MYLPPGCIPAKANVAGTFLWEGGDPIGGILRATSLYTVNAGRQFTRALVYYSQEEPEDATHCDQWEASVDRNDYGLTGPLLTMPGDPFLLRVCFFIVRPTSIVNLYCN